MSEPADEKKKDDGAPCCECCCGSDQKEIDERMEKLERGGIFEDRSCTDLCMIVLYAAFLVGWIVIISLAAATGDPNRLIKPDNFRGQLCGDGDLSNMSHSFVPKPSRTSYTLCVNTCPAIGDFVCNNDKEPLLTNINFKVFNTYYDHTVTQYTAGSFMRVKCATACSAAEQVVADRFIGLQLKLNQKKCFPVWYPTAVKLLRCIPGTGGASSQNATLRSLANETAGDVTALLDTLGVGTFFTLGFSEIEQCWKVIILSAVICMFIAFVWVFLLRWILAPIVYFCIVLIFGLLLGIGFIFRYFADDLESGALPGEGSVEDTAKLYRALQYIFWAAAAIYLGIMVNMMTRIRIAIAVMKEASKAFTATTSMCIIPMITFPLLCGWIAFFIVASVYIQTMGEEAAEQFASGATALLGTVANISALVGSNTNSNIDASASSASNTSESTFNSSAWTTLPSTKVLHMYNFFGVLWTGNICIMFGFMTMVFCVCSWYFSATQEQLRNAEAEDDEQKEQGKIKETDACVVFTAARTVLCNHLGTVMWGSLLIAIIQFIRAVFTYIAENYLKSDAAKDNMAAKILLRCAECCLWYIEQVIRIISKNAFIVTAIKNTNFCASAYQALKMLLSNAGRLAILTMLSTATIWLVKVFIVGINILATWGLMKQQSLTDDRPVESGLWVYFGVIIMSFVIASLFLNVYEACVDTIFLCFLVDEEDFKGKFMPETLSVIVDMFKGAEEARLQYEKAVREAAAKSDEITAEPKKAV